MLDSFLPKGAPFFEYLIKQNGTLCSLCALVPDQLENGHPSEVEGHREAARLEEEGDATYQMLVKDLSQTFITPIDREDILRIAKEQENTIDLLQNLVARLHVFNVTNWPLPIKKISRNVSAMVVLTGVMLEGLSRKQDSHNTREFRALRNECEMLLSAGLGEALDISDMTPEALLMLVKVTRAYDRMEQAIQQVVALAEAIEEAVLKNV